MVVVLEEGISVELDHLISDAAAAELIANGLGDEYDDLYREVSSITGRDMLARLKRTMVGRM